MDRLEFKAAISVDEEGRIEGLASVFGTADRGGDVVHKGAFAGASFPKPMLSGHDPNEVIGVWTEGIETPEGLRVKGQLTLTVQRAREVRDLILAKALEGLSIGYQAIRKAARKGGGRDLFAVDLLEISVVAVPMHPGARITSAKGNDMTETTETTEMPDISAFEAKLADIEKKADPAPLLARLDKLEAKANRGTGSTEGVEAIERKALASFVRTGSDHEIKQATSSSDPDGGYFILPTVDLSIRNLLADVSPLRALAEVVGISGNSYERFYSTGNRGAQWVGETDDRPQDTARPNLIKHSYGVAELYAAPAGTRHLFEDASIDIAAWFSLRRRDLEPLDGVAVVKAPAHALVGVQKDRALAAHLIAHDADAVAVHDHVTLLEVAEGDGEGIGLDVGQVVVDMHRIAQQRAAFGAFRQVAVIRPHEPLVAVLDFADADQGGIVHQPGRAGPIARMQGQHGLDQCLRPVVVSGRAGMAGRQILHLAPAAGRIGGGNDGIGGQPTRAALHAVARQEGLALGHREVIDRPGGERT